MYTQKKRMPFGEHRGIMLKRVPAGYLLYLLSEWTEDIRSKSVIERLYPGLYDYLAENKGELEARQALENSESESEIRARLSAPQDV